MYYLSLYNKYYNVDISNDNVPGGIEGKIFPVYSNSSIVAKIYKDNNLMDERERKLKVMLGINPSSSITNICSWPLDLLYNNGNFIGYIMHSFKGFSNLLDVYNHDKRNGIPWTYFVHLALNLSKAVYNIHEINQIIGDLNPKNIMVSNTGQIIIVDTDSFHIRDHKTGLIYRCGVGFPQCVAPEIQGWQFRTAPLPTFTEYTDRFSLAVLIFKILMNGAHPFAVKLKGEGSASKVDPVLNIKNCKCAYFRETKSIEVDIPPYSPSLRCLPNDIIQLFGRAFVMSHFNPIYRPSAEEWCNSLEKLRNELVKCEYNHYYYKHASECPWCKLPEELEKRRREQRRIELERLRIAQEYMEKERERQEMERLEREKKYLALKKIFFFLLITGLNSLKIIVICAAWIFILCLFGVELNIIIIIIIAVSCIKTLLEWDDDDVSL